MVHHYYSVVLNLKFLEIMPHFLQISFFDVFFFRFTVHLDGFHLSVNDTLHNRLGDSVMQLPSLDNQIPVNCLPSVSPVCIIGSLQKANQIIYTNSEFQTMQFVKIQVSLLAYGFSVLLTEYIVKCQSFYLFVGLSLKLIPLKTKWYYLFAFSSVSNHSEKQVCF